MHGIEQFLGLIVLLLWIVATVVKQAKRSAQTAPPVRPAAPRRAAPAAAGSQGVHAQFAQNATPVGVPRQAAAPAAAAPPPVPAPRIAAPPVQPASLAPLLDLPHPVMLRPKASRFHQLFNHRSALVRAVVASEVIGKPRALRDECSHLG